MSSDVLQKAMSRRALLQAATTALGASLLAACAPKAAPTPTPVQVQATEPPATAAPGTQVPQPTGPVLGVGGDATGAPYYKKAAINEGKPIKLTWWDWWTARMAPMRRLAAEYMALYPNVTIEITQIPSDYEAKITAAAPAGQGPDILQFHNGNHTPFIKANLIDIFPEDMFVPGFLEQHYIGMKEHHFHDEDGHLRYMPYGCMAPLVYVNKTYWDEAGLTDNDWPKSWEELLDVAVKLTKRDDAGTTLVAGFSFNDQCGSLVMDMNLQRGQWTYSQDGKSVKVDNEISRLNYQILQRFYDEKVLSPKDLGWYEAFGTGKAAMAPSMTYYGRSLTVRYPDVQWFTIPYPTVTGENLPSKGGFNYEVGLAVSPQSTPEKKAVAWDFLHWFMSNPEKLVDMAILHNVTPAYLKLVDHPYIKASVPISQLAAVMEYHIFPGDWPGPFWDAVYQYMTQGWQTGMSVDEVLRQTQEVGDRTMQAQEFRILERGYAHADKMLPNQP